MRILIVTQRWYPDAFGGSEHVASEQARRLAARGHEVYVFTERVRDGLPYEAKEAGMRIMRYGSESALKRFGGSSRTDVYEIPRLIKDLAKREKREPEALWDIAMAHHPFPARGLLKAGLPLPMLYLFHSSTAREAEMEGIRRKLNWPLKLFRPLLNSAFVRFALKVERAGLARADKIAVLSEFSKKVLQGILPESENKIIRLSAGIDLEKFHPDLTVSARARLGLPEGQPVILTVRRFSPRMGLSTLIVAMEEVFEKMPDLHLLIVGEGPLREDLQKQIEARNLKNKITLVGSVPLDDLPLYYQAADLFVLPTEAFEGLGMATLEALASGTPVVGTPAGATPEILKDLDFALVAAGTGPDDIAKGILSFFVRPQKERAALRKKARALAEKKYNWDRAVEELEGVLKKLTSTKIGHE